MLTLYRFARLLPLDTASALGGWVARMIGPRLGLTRVARQNLATALPELSPARVEAVIREMWDNIGRLATEHAHIDRFDIFPGDGRIEVVGVEHLKQAVARGRPMICFTGHYGNWELTALTMAQFGVPLGITYRAANNPRVDRLIREGRSPMALSFLPKGAEGARAAMEMLAAGKSIGLLIDQKMNDGVPIAFFGRPAMTATGLARLALRYDCTIVPGRVERLSGARFRATIYPPLDVARTGDAQADQIAIMTAATSMVEAWVRERPGQWFWVHRRW